MANTKLLTGHSGCKIELINDNKKIFVRKTSSNIDYNNRLLKQCEKQNFFFKQGDVVIKTPEIYGQGYHDDGLFYFDMEYINGEKFSDFMKTANVSCISEYAEVLVHYIVKNISQKPDESVRNEFSKKINELEYKIKPSGISRLAIKLVKEIEWKSVATSGCHGDLTFENIIIKHGQIYLIDFLDSFYDSWVIDAAKIMQDTEVVWSYRNSLPISENLEIRLLVFKKFFLKSLEEYGNTTLLPTIYGMLLINLLRILPYTNSKRNLEFVNTAMRIVISKLEKYQPFSF